MIGPQHAGADSFWPVPGQGLGYGDAFVVFVRSLLGALGAGPAASPTFLDGVRAAEIVAAAQASAARGAWTAVERMPAEE